MSNGISGHTPLRTRIAHALLIAVTPLVCGGTVTLAVAAGCAGTTGCAAIAAALPAIGEIVSDGSLILSTIETFASSFFQSHPDTSAQAKVTAALTKTRLALIAAERTISGLKDVTARDYAAAFAEFRDAYAELLQVVAPVGVSQEDVALSADAGADAGAPATLTRARVVHSPSGPRLIVPAPKALALGNMKP